MTIDEKDKRILEILEENSKLTTGKIAKKTGIPVTTVHNRIRRLEHEGIIKTYRPVLDYRKLDRGIHGLIFVTAEGKADQEALSNIIKGLPHVTSVKIITGGYDLLVEVRVDSIETMNQLLIQNLRKLQGIDKTQTMIVLQE